MANIPKTVEGNNCPEEEGSQFEEAKRELETWKTKVEKADDVKARLILEKLEQDEAKTKAQQEMMACSTKQEECQKEFLQSMNAVQDEILKFDKSRQDLLDKLKRNQAKLESKRADSTKLKQKFKIYAMIPDTEVRFSGQNKEDTEDDRQPIRGVFAITQRPTVLLQGGQALLTFEEEKVASLAKSLALTGKYRVDLDSEVTVQVGPIYKYQLRKFQTFCGSSKRTILVDDIKDVEDEEDLQDHLEIHFQKPSNYGGEIESIKYISRGKALQAFFLCEDMGELDF